MSTKTKRLAAACGALAAMAAMAPAASADFDGVNQQRCTGDSITGTGATFPGEAQAAWTKDFRENLLGEGCPLFQVTGQTITYNLTGSGAGRKAMGMTSSVPIDTTKSFAGSDTAPTSTEMSTSNTQSGTLVHSIPVTSGAVAVIVNAPDGCAIPSGVATSDGRFRVSNAALEDAYAGTTTTWGGLLGSACATPITRVVRSDSSGTTDAFKSWLQTIDAATGWAGANKDTTWPGAVTRAAGNPGVIDKVKTTDGALGYADLAGARAGGFGLSATGDGEYWIELANGSGAYAEPSAQAATSTAKGANCDLVSYSALPAGTTQSWSAVTGIGSSDGYPICTLTYALAFEDPSKPYGSGAQGRARTVTDYIRYQLTESGQSVAAQADYSRLPVEVLAKALAGAAELGWNK